MCWNKKILEMLMTVMILMGAFCVGTYSAKVLETGNVSSINEEINEEEQQKKILENKIIIIDCGHGGFDSGKVGINGALEKEINLEIGKYLRKILEDAGARIIMTRETDVGLYDDNEEHKKQQDMKRRVQVINESGAEIAISIHQNSYTEEYVNGPQVFYYENSQQGKMLAENLQQKLNQHLEIESPRKIKGNTTYYILCKTEIPTVIVECGFLSNSQEAAKLTELTYQQKIAEAISYGIEDYLKEESKGE